MFVGLSKASEKRNPRASNSFGTGICDNTASCNQNIYQNNTEVVSALFFSQGQFLAYGIKF